MRQIPGFYIDDTTRPHDAVKIAQIEKQVFLVHMAENGHRVCLVKAVVGENPFKTGTFKLMEVNVAQTVQSMPGGLEHIG